MAYPVTSRDALEAEVSFEDRLDLLSFASYLVARWRLVAITCVFAVSAAGIASSLMTKTYTATASLLIEPPAGNDPRGATAISPVYVESLKTYERFALSDTLFFQALDQLGLRKLYAGSVNRVAEEEGPSRHEAARYENTRDQCYTSRTPRMLKRWPSLWRNIRFN